MWAVDESADKSVIRLDKIVESPVALFIFLG